MLKHLQEYPSRLKNPRSHKILGGIVFGCGLIGLLVWASTGGYQRAGYRISAGGATSYSSLNTAGTTQEAVTYGNVKEAWGCNFVTNNTASDLFVPTKTQAEWNTLVSNKPSGVVINDCKSILLGQFDYLVIRYLWPTPAGTDLDIMVGFEGTTTPYDNKYIGFGSTNFSLIPAGSTTPYLKWGTDNTANGVESVLIDIKKFMADYPTAPNPIRIYLYGVRYNTRGNGNITLELTSYKGGTMVLNGYDWTNPTGTQVTKATTDVVNVLAYNKSFNPSYADKVAVMSFDQDAAAGSLDLIGQQCTWAGCSDGGSSSSSYCGDGSCDSGEDYSSCSSDCGGYGYCGDGYCNNGEDYYSCYSDC